MQTDVRHGPQALASEHTPKPSARSSSRALQQICWPNMSCIPRGRVGVSLLPQGLCNMSRLEVKDSSNHERRICIRSRQVQGFAHQHKVNLRLVDQVGFRKQLGGTASTEARDERTLQVCAQHRNHTVLQIRWDHVQVYSAKK